MKAGPVTVRQLLENRQRFCVPIYQRHYVWARDKQWEPFWNDVRTKAIERLNSRERRFSHFMGAVVLEARGAVSSRQVTSFQVVDGQQRLTTFQLYLAAARDYAKQAGFEDTVGLIEGYLFNEKEHLMEDPDVEKYKVWPTKYDRELFQDIVTAGRPALRKKYREHFYKGRDKIYEYSTIPKLLGAYGYFFDRIKHAVESDDLEDDFAETIEVEVDDDDGAAPAPEPDQSEKDRAAMELRLDALWEALIEEFKVVEITLEEGDDAQVIFETLNEDYGANKTQVVAPKTVNAADWSAAATSTPEAWTNLVKFDRPFVYLGKNAFLWEVRYTQNTSTGATPSTSSTSAALPTRRRRAALCSARRARVTGRSSPASLKMTFYNFTVKYDINVSVAQMPASAPVWVFLDFQNRAIKDPALARRCMPCRRSCCRCLGTTSSAGSLSYRFSDLPRVPGIANAKLYFQAMAVDFGQSGAPFALTNALDVTIPADLPHPVVRNYHYKISSTSTSVTTSGPWAGGIITRFGP